MSTDEAKQLPTGFAPGDMDVIVGRGKVCYKHSGNQKLARVVANSIPVYSNPSATKKSKSELIKGIMHKVRESSPTGGFVKFDSDTGMWYEVGDRIAREKVSQTFRDALNDRYKSSTTSKTLKRRQERINRHASAGSKDSGSSTGEGGATGASTTTTPSSAAAGPAGTSRNVSITSTGPTPSTQAQQQTQSKNTAAEIPEAQARLDSLLWAATTGVNNVNRHLQLHQTKPPGFFSAMAPPGMTPLSSLSGYRSSSLLGGPGAGAGGFTSFLAARQAALLMSPGSSRLGPAGMSYMGPSLDHLMTPGAGGSVAVPMMQANRYAMLMSQEMELRRSMLSSTHAPAAAPAAAATTKVEAPASSGPDP